MSFERAERRRQQRQAEAKTPLPAFIDLVDWVKMRSKLSTKRALSVIMAGALKADGRTVGVRWVQRVDGSQIPVIVRFVSTNYRGRIEIVTPEGLDD